jgi:hypothetical protein
MEKMVHLLFSGLNDTCCSPDACKKVDDKGKRLSDADLLGGSCRINKDENV